MKKFWVCGREKNWVDDMAVFGGEGPGRIGQHRRARGGSSRAHLLFGSVKKPGERMTKVQYKFGSNASLIRRALDDYPIPRMSISYWRRIVDSLGGAHAKIPFNKKNASDLARLVMVHSGNARRFAREARQKIPWGYARGPNWERLSSAIESAPVPPAPLSHWLDYCKSFFARRRRKFGKKEEQDLKQLLRATGEGSTNYSNSLLVIGRRKEGETLLVKNPAEEKKIVLAMISRLKRRGTTPHAVLVQEFSSNGIVTTKRSLQFLEYMLAGGGWPHFLPKPKGG